MNDTVRKILFIPYFIMGSFLYIKLDDSFKRLLIENNQIAINHLCFNHHFYDEYTDDKLKRHSKHFYRCICAFLFSRYGTKHILKVNNLWSLDKTYSIVTYKRLIDNYELTKDSATNYHIFKVLSEYIKKYKPNTIIEMGCGNAVFSLFLQERFKDNDINFVATDINESNIIYLKEHIKNITFLRYDAISLLYDIIFGKIKFKSPILFFDYYVLEYLNEQELMTFINLLSNIKNSVFVSSQPSGYVKPGYYDKDKYSKQLKKSGGLIIKNYPYYLNGLVDEMLFETDCENGANICLGVKIN